MNVVFVLLVKVSFCWLKFTTTRSHGVLLVSLVATHFRGAISHERAHVWPCRFLCAKAQEKGLHIQETTSDSQHFKSLRRGVLRAFWDLKAENGVFFRTEVFLDSIFSFLLIFLSNAILDCTRSYKRGVAGEGELPRFVPNKPMC